MNTSDPDYWCSMVLAKVQDLIADNGFPGLALALVTCDRTLICRGFGRRGAQDQNEITDATIFQLASLSKIITTTVISCELVDWSELDRPVALSLRPTPTRRQALAHITGLPPASGDYQERVGYPKDRIEKQLLAYATTTESFSYQNYLFALAADELVNQSAYYRFFNRIGMVRASLGRWAFDQAVNRAVGHLDGTIQPSYATDATMAASGVNASAQDLSHFLRYHLSSTSGTTGINYRRLLEPQIKRSDSGSYGLGINIDSINGLAVYSHSGAFETGAHTYLMWIPARNIGLAVLTNALPTGFPEALGAYLRVLVQGGTANQAQNSYREWELKVAACFSIRTCTPCTTPPQRVFPYARYSSPIYGGAHLRPPNLLRLGRASWSRVSEEQSRLTFVLVTPEGQRLPATLAWNEEELMVRLGTTTARYHRRPLKNTHLI